MAGNDAVTVMLLRVRATIMPSLAARRARVARYRRRRAAISRALRHVTVSVTVHDVGELAALLELTRTVAV